jgi:hypothetical protein
MEEFNTKFQQKRRMETLDCGEYLFLPIDMAPGGDGGIVAKIVINLQ